MRLIFAGGTFIVVTGATFLMLWLAWAMIHQRSTRITAGAVLAAASFFTAFSGAAYATSSTADATVYRGAPDCENAHVYINNTSATPYLNAQNNTFQWDYSSNTCWTGLYYDNFGPYNLAVREDLYVNHGSGWVACNYGPWIYNNNTASSVATSWWPNHPCGSGWYFDSGGADYYNNGWVGGWTQTPNAVWVP